MKWCLLNSKNGLPFGNNEFDCPYNRKGPTSACPYLKRIIKQGGEALGLHPDDDLGKELSHFSPEFFPHTIGTPIIDKLEKEPKNADFSYYSIDAFNSTEYLQSPIDIIKYRCFGQKPNIYERVIKENLSQISGTFRLSCNLFTLYCFKI
ncbi:hypothetical protein [Cytobacillus purgationiresistens]|uniref:Uncharacterized protein n=1 Tax=Cytobacillus purgationiresistens TaxID=863449 RepID=A0ABU0AC69_9BACI|nr:hypothetical protein [Cytobacillus purgationiresistens]MDQ0268311.1 hypothetical protein [Cytobacillus purgationiresistens]